MNKFLTKIVSIKLVSALFGLSLLFLSDSIANAQNKANLEQKTYDNSAWVMYDSAVSHIYKGEIALAKSDLRKILNGFDNGKFVECSDESTVRLLQYKSHVVLSNIAFAEKDIDNLNNEVMFFENADTTKTEWKSAQYAATHFKHKSYQLSHDKFGKVIGDYVSLCFDNHGVPMVWIRVYCYNNTLFAELKDCAVKSFLNSKYAHPTDKIVLDNIENTIQMNFGESKLMPGLQFLPIIAVKLTYDFADALTEVVVRKTIAETGKITAGLILKESAINLGATLIAGLVSLASITKETVTAETFVMEEIAPEIYQAKIRLRSFTKYSNGEQKDEFNWAELPVFHLYPQETKDFSNGHFVESLEQSASLFVNELSWEGNKGSENMEMAKITYKDIVNSCFGICNVEETSFPDFFYFLGKNINNAKFDNFSFFSPNEIKVSFASSFSGLARAKDLWGMKRNPTNPITNKCETNLYIRPLRGVFKTVISPGECVTFTGDYNHDENSASGLLCYTNTDSPELSFTYDGTLLKGYPHGLGIWQGNGYRYVGWFYKGKKFGPSTIIYDDGREEQGFVAKDGSIIPDALVTEKMRRNFDKKAKKIAKHKYKTLNYE